MTQTALKITQTFFSQFPQIQLKTGEIIVQPDRTLTHVFFLKTGKIRMYAISPDGEEVTLHIFRPESYLPFMLFLSNIPNKYYFESVEPGVAIKAPVDAVMDFLKRDPEALFDLTKRFSDALCGLLQRIESFAFESAYNKIIHLLLYLADKFGQKKEGKAIITISLSHEDIAQWVGLRRETVSRQLERLQKRGLVDTDGKHLVLPNIQKLKDELDTE